MNITYLKQLINQLLVFSQQDFPNKQAIIDETKELINRNFYPIKTIKPTYYPIKKTIYFQPWGRNNYILYISLLIDENSNIGQAIKARTESITNVNPFDPLDPNHSPHISLLKLYVKEGTELDNLLINKFDQDYLDFPKKAYIIKNSFDNNLLNYSLDSKSGNYDTFGNFIVRKYNDSKNISTIQIQHYKFICDIITQFMPNFFTEENIKYMSGPSDTNVLLTHYIQQKYNKTKYTPKYTHSDIAVDSFYSSNWIPHISLTKFNPISENPYNLILNYQKQSFSTNPLNPVNLWSSSKQIKGVFGSINQIYISYSHKHPEVYYKPSMLIVI